MIAPHDRSRARHRGASGSSLSYLWGTLLFLAAVGGLAGTLRPIGLLMIRNQDLQGVYLLALPLLILLGRRAPRSAILTGAAVWLLLVFRLFVDAGGEQSGTCDLSEPVDLVLMEGAGQKSFTGAAKLPLAVLARVERDGETMPSALEPFPWHAHARQVDGSTVWIGSTVEGEIELEDLGRNDLPLLLARIPIAGGKLRIGTLSLPESGTDAERLERNRLAVRRLGARLRHDPQPTFLFTRLQSTRFGPIYDRLASGARAYGASIGESVLGMLGNFLFGTEHVLWKNLEGVEIDASEDGTRVVRFQPYLCRDDGKAVNGKADNGNGETGREEAGSEAS